MENFKPTYIREREEKERLIQKIFENTTERIEGYEKSDSEHKGYEYGCCIQCGKDVGGHWSGGEGVCSSCNI